MNRMSVRAVAVELLVVVSGILIAFTVDRWNQDRQERRAEAAYLEALTRDLQADTAALGRLVRLYQLRAEAAGRVQGALALESPFVGDAAALAWDINNAGYVTAFQPSDITYRELLSTGGLGLIRDPELKRDMVAYYQRVEWVAQFVPNWQGYSREYNGRVLSHVAAEDWAAIEASSGGAGDRPVRADAVLQAIRRDDAVHKALSSVLAGLKQQADSHEALRVDALRLLNVLSPPGE